MKHYIIKTLYYIIKKNEKLYTTYIISLRDISEKLLLII